MSHLWFLVCTFLVYANATEDAFDGHLQKAKLLFAKRQYSNALTEFHSALDLNPKHSEALFRRATCYQSLNRYKAALKDLDLLIEIRPNNVVAYKQRGTIYLKRGFFDEAEKNFKKAIELEPSDSLRESLEETGTFRSLVETSIASYNAQDYTKAQNMMETILETLYWDCNLLKLHALSQKNRGEIGQAIQSLEHASRVCPETEEIYVETANLKYERGEIEEALSSIRKCLKTDPDSSTCNPVYKKLKKFVKEYDKMKKFQTSQDWDKCVEKGSQILQKKLEDIERIVVLKSRCLCNKMAENFDAALLDCNAALEGLPTSAEILCLRAEVNIELEAYEDAEKDYEEALNLEPGNEDAKGGKENVEKARRNERTKDYYKILGVSRSASKREITKAYRKLAQKWHPDNFATETEKKRAEKKFIDIASAKEVLTDDEKRRRFDGGEDPLSGEGREGHFHDMFRRQQHHGNSFFGGGFDPSQFEFHFG